MTKLAFLINEDASHVLTLNERLTRYALYVSQLERSNKELGAQVETVMAQLAASNTELQATKDGIAKTSKHLAKLQLHTPSGASRSHPSSRASTTRTRSPQARRPSS